MALTTQVSGLKEINETLKKYLEAVMTGAGPDASSKLIESEERRLEEVRRQEILRSNHWCEHITRSFEVPFDDFVSILKRSTTFEEFAKLAAKKSPDLNAFERIIGTLHDTEAARRDFNDARSLVGMSPISFDQEIGSTEELTLRSIGTRRKRRAS